MPLRKDKQRLGHSKGGPVCRMLRMAESSAGPGGPGDSGAEGLPVVVWPQPDGGLLLQDMRSFGRATGPDLSLGLQSPPPAFLSSSHPPLRMPSMSLWDGAGPWGWLCSVHPVGRPLGASVSFTWSHHIVHGGWDGQLREATVGEHLRPGQVWEAQWKVTIFRTPEACCCIPGVSGDGKGMASIS